MTNCLNILKADEYIENNIIYCKSCNTPRQCILDIGDIKVKHYIKCRCQMEKYETTQKEISSNQKLMKVLMMKSSGLQDKSLKEYRFEYDNGINPEISKAHDYVKNWDKMKESSLGLLVWGDVGTGKSFFAGCIANALIENGVPVLMTNFSRILNTLTGMISDDKNRFIDSFNKYNLLIIDDLGIERNSEFALEQVFNVIDSRYRSKLPLIITTNLTLDELKNPKDLAHARIYDRVLQQCVPLKINNQNIRQMQAMDNIKKAKILLANKEV